MLSKIVLLLILSQVFIVTSALGQTFQFIKLKPDLQSWSSKSQAFSDRGPVISKEISSVILNSGKSGLASVDTEESPLFSEIRTYLNERFQNIGETEAHQIDIFNQQFNLGEQNYSGFSWQKPFGAIQIYADRQVTPNLFESNWIVQDTFTIEAEAATILEKLNEAGVTAMSATEIGAFVGITFKRVYTIYHYADTYAKGLRADFTKLFLPFLYFDVGSVNKLKDQEIIKKQDAWTIAAGGVISSPPTTGLGGTAGILAEANFKNNISLQAFHTNVPSAQRFLVQVGNEKGISVGISAELQLDFFKLLKLTLLTFDLEYELSSNHASNISLKEQDWAFLQNSDSHMSEFKRVLRGKSKIQALESYVITLDESQTQTLKKSTGLLLWGKIKKTLTEKVRVIKDQEVKEFFRFHSSSLRTIQNFWNRLLGEIVYRLLDLPMGVKNSSEYAREMDFEYDGSHPQASDPKNRRVFSTQDISINLKQSYTAHRTDRWVDKKFKADLIWFIENFTALPADYRTFVRQEKLKGPMLVESTLRLETAAINYFIERSDDEVFNSMAKVCLSKRSALWSVKESRQKLLKNLQIGKDLCVKKMGLKFLSFKADYQQKAGLAVSKLKDFLGTYFQEAQHWEELELLFGKGNVFFHGSLKAQTAGGKNFYTTFSSGQFRGLGLIDNFKRAAQGRQPAAIRTE